MASFGQDNTTKFLSMTADGWIPSATLIGDERESFGYQLKETDNGLEFSLTGTPGSIRLARWTKEIKNLNFTDYQFIVIEYKTRWLSSLRNEVVGLTMRDDKNVSGDTTLLSLS